MEPIGLVQCTIRFSIIFLFEMSPIKLIEDFPHLPISPSALRAFIVRRYLRLTETLSASLRHGVIPIFCSSLWLNNKKMDQFCVLYR